MSVRECTIDYLMETTCIYLCALLCLKHVKFYVPEYYHINHCNVAQALVHCQRNAPKQMFNNYINGVTIMHVRDC